MIRPPIFRHILIVDDSEDDRNAIKGWLSQNIAYHYTFEEADSVESGIELYEQKQFDCVILDHSFPRSGAADFLRLAINNERVKQPSPIIVITGQGSERIAVASVKAGAQDYISKTELFSPAESNHRFLDEAISDFKHSRELSESHRERDRLLAKLKRKTRQLIRAKAEADTANVTKSAFLANMSHEIRTPLTAIIGFTDLLVAESISEFDRAYLYETIKKNGIHLLSVINDILDLSKVEAGKVAITYSRFDISTLVEELESSFRKSFEAKNVRLRFFFNSKTRFEIESDRTRVRQILTNLMANALKFTLQGEVSIVILGSGSADEGGEFSIVVSDTGVGMTRSESKKIFRRFSQANPDVGSKFGGTGIGLALSKNLAALMGGDLRLVSTEPGVGSVFKLKLPLKPPSPQDQIFPHEVAVKRHVSLKGIRILVADDSFDNQFLIRRYLEGANAQVTCVSDGSELIDSYVEGQFDVIVSDVKMPIMDGHEAARVLRSRGVEIPIIGLSASAMSDDRARSAAAGFSDQLSKPIDPNDLIQTVAKLTSDIKLGARESEGPNPR